MSVMSSRSTKQPETTASVRKLAPQNAPRKRVILSMGGKGGVGKTNVMTGLAEWYRDHEIPVTLLDLDTENKARGSLTHFFEGRVPKVNIHTPEGLDAFLDYLTKGRPLSWQTWVAAPGE
jgi:Mrp family chromosome partitioning ATPase